MAHAYAGTELPQSAESAADLALTKVAAFLRAVVNEWCAASWGAVGSQPLPDPIKSVRTHDPQRGAFNEKELPCLYVWRDAAQGEDWAVDWRITTGTIAARWVYEPEPLNKQTRRAPFAMGPLRQALDAALYLGRHPAWADDGDPQYDAATLAADPDAFVLAFATPTVATTVTTLDGALGGAELSPRRSLTITTAVATGAYNTAAPVVVTYLDWAGVTRTASLQPTNANGGETLEHADAEARQVVSYAVPSQPSGTGQFSFGAGAFEGAGSVLVDRSGLDRVRMQKAAPQEFKFRLSDGTERGPYASVLFTFEYREVLVLDAAVGTYPNSAAETSIVASDGYELSHALWDHPDDFDPADFDAEDFYT